MAGFSYAILDSIEQEIAVIQKDGQIVYVNEAWVRFGANNGLPKTDWLQSNYLDICISAALSDEPAAQDIYAGLAGVIHGHRQDFSYEYPCDSPDEKRWFLMNVVGLTGHSKDLFVIIHSNISQRKLAEQQVERLSLLDPLTGLANRRHFMQFLTAEWQRNRREGTPVSLILLDIDDFKHINDQHGHGVGDECLKQIASLVGRCARRPSDLAVRWGGEEFMLVLGNTSVETALTMANELLAAVRRLESPVHGHCTISIGVSSAVPTEDGFEALIQQADSALYQAKKAGKNQVFRYGQSAS
ncbi:MAG: diguanylate cyclase [Curvibacter lanceolatus]|uniref:GGDEF domain-containing protein n=1 Tax=Curvibacter lanceolatus TaxID=86182 RepID=UPI000377777D|nr:diguanylate cyclase [Curvibacter lanceolatus]MBV5293530.1 diguanylate cyclase [Curvibacter lanceolatus]